MKKIFIFIFILFSNFMFSEKIHIQSGYLEKRFVEGDSRIIIKGTTKKRAILKLETKIIQGDKIEIWGENNRFVQCDGNIDIIDSEEDVYITGNSFFYDRDKDILKVNGNVYLEDKKNSIVVRSNYIESFNKEKIINMQMNVRIFKENTTARAEFAIYDRAKENLELFGFPIVYKDNDEYQSTKILINLDTDEITLQGKVKGKLESEKEDKKEN